MQGKATEYEMDEANTLEDLKKKIADDQKLDVSSLKLIHYGKVLNDNTKKLCDLGIKPKDFLVLMPSKVNQNLILFLAKSSYNCTSSSSRSSTSTCSNC